jgi:nascent polypeptide-associated complex subunit alpha
MFPGGMNPRQMNKMMKQMGIKNDDIPASKVTIETDGKTLVFDHPQVQLMEVQGQKTYTVIGTPKEESSIPEDDITMVAEQASVSKEDAQKALEENDGDIAQAIASLQE